MSIAPSRKVTGFVLDIVRDGNRWITIIQTDAGILRRSVRSVVVASGRQGADLLVRAGAVSQHGKGVDVGVRVEFSARENASGLSALGPDAKILSGPCRTFCLNSPGKVMRYAFGQINIPGGIVAEPDWPTANVGLVFRQPDKAAAIDRVLRAYNRFPAETFEGTHSYSGSLQLPDAELQSLFGTEVTEALHAFGDQLSTAGLLDFGGQFSVHIPLLDWHWPVFAQHRSSMTSLQGVFAAGDIAGHARGLLQAAISGWLCAHEVMALS